MGETDIIEFVVTEEKCKEIQNFEAEMLEKYIKAIYPYLPLFNGIGYELKVELGWYNSIHRIWSNSRPPLKNGYECYVYCIVEKGGEEVRIKSNDGEVDYYPLVTSWIISSVFRRLHKLKVSYYVNIDDVDTDLNEFLSQLKQVE